MWFDERGEYADAHDAILEALRLNPILSRSDIFFHNQTWIAALDEFIVANLTDLEKNQNFIAWQTLGRSNYDDAEIQFRATIASNPLSTSGYQGLSETQLSTGRYDDAHNSIQIALFLNSSDPYSHFLLGRIHEANNEYDLAIMNYSAGFEALKNLSDSWSFYARTYHRFFPEPDLVPQIIRYFPTVQELGVFCTLYSHYIETNQQDMAIEIEDMLARLSPNTSCGAQ